MKKFLLLSIIALAIPTSSQAQIGPQQMVASSYTVDGLDQNATSLPVSYMGQNPYDVFLSLIRVLGPKGEFENTADFKARQARGANMPLVGQLTSKSNFAARIDPGSISTSYDADKSRLTVQIIYDNNLFMPSLQVYREETPKGTYKAQNAFGVERDVVKVDRLRINLVWKNGRKNGAKSTSIDSVDFRISLSPDQARRFKDKIAVLAVYSPSEPYIGLEKDVVTPKIDNPVEANVESLLIHANVSQFWIYDTESGALLQKITLKK